MDLSYKKAPACPPAIVRSYKNGDFTDLTITCGPLTFRVHAVVVCPLSDFFRKSLKFAVGKEAEERCIDLPEDDPEMIRRLIEFAYLGEYGPSDAKDIESFCALPTYESSAVAPSTHHSRRGAFSGATRQCACLALNTKKVAQPMRTDGGPKTCVEKAANTVEIANPLTIHATMYALGDKYQVAGLCALAKMKFEACLSEHAQSEDFITAVQIAYSSTPDTNRGLRDAVVNAFRTEFKTDIKQMPGAEAKLDCIDELSFLLIKSWPAKIEPEKPAPMSTTAGVFGGRAASPAARVSQPAPTGTSSIFALPVAQPASGSSRPLFGGSQPPAATTTLSLFGNPRP